MLCHEFKQPVGCLELNIIVNDGNDVFISLATVDE